VYNEVETYLVNYDIFSEADIDAAVRKLAQPPYNEEDVQNIMEYVEVVDYDVELELFKKIKSLKNKNLDNQQELEDLPLSIARGESLSLSVDKKSDKSDLKRMWETVLEKDIKVSLSENSEEINERKSNLRNELEADFTFYDTNRYL